MSEEDVDIVDNEAPKQVRITAQNFDEKLQEFRVMSETVSEISDKLKVAKAEQENLSYWLAQYMLTGAIKSICLHGVVYTQKQKVFSKVEDKDALRSWIMDNDAVDLLMAVHPSKLTAYCNEQLESGGTTPTGVNPNYIKYYVHSK